VTVRGPLHVWLYGRHVADVVDAGFGDTAVRYTADAVEHPAGAMLSLSMPPQSVTYPTVGPGGRWVRSLLPEGRALDWVVEHYGIPSDDRFGLIAALGADVAGAVQVIDPGLDDDSTDPRYERLTDSEVAERVERAHDAPLGLDPSRRVRLSLAGVQDKVLLHRDADGWLLPINGAPSTLIVKPEPPHRHGMASYAGLATNEAFCSALARRCGIDAATSSVQRFGETSALVVERYDRVVAADGVTRVHQEDLLGALGLDPLVKYEVPHAHRRPVAGGWGTSAAHAVRGPGLGQLAAVIEQHLGLAFVVEFAERVVFNLAIGNADAHARNYSLLLSADSSAHHAPMYDMVCTMLYPNLDTDVAQLVNDCADLHDITLSDIVAEITGWGIPAQLAQRRARTMLMRVAAKVDAATVDCIDRGGDPTVADQMAILITGRATALLAT
jgi:serine/threonine-protein kinase HipA